MKTPISVFWFRRDLRLEDNAGLYHALKSGKPVLPIFIFDTNIIHDLEDKKDKRVCFIWDSLKHIQTALEKLQSSLYIFYSSPLEAFQKLSKEFSIEAVYTNHDYEPYAQQRDEAIQSFLKEHHIAFHSFKDQVIFEKDEILKEDKTPYTVYTPYSKKWKEKLNDFYKKPYPTSRYFDNFLKQEPKPFPSLAAMGFETIAYDTVPPKLDEGIAKTYDQTRNFPAINGTTKLSVHLRFGTVSIRKLVTEAQQINGTLLNELIWRDFFASVLWHYPHTVTLSFRKEYDGIIWRNNEDEFAAWCNGKTGYPIVDAGMRELNATGFMHNRVRMIVASFLCKHLLIDWRWGEAYFAKKLMDYDLSQNIGNWQWAAGSGVDAAPYFRIFNPYIQEEKFDKAGAYRKKWLPELGTEDYPKPIVEHELARVRCLQVYKQALQK